MRLSLTLVLILSIITHGYSDPKKPKKPTKCTSYSCSDWDWQNKKGLFDPHSIRWPLHYTGEIFKDKIDGGHYDIDVVFNHYGHKTRVPLKGYRNSTYHPDPWFLDKGLKMNDPFTCDYWVEDRPYWKENHCAMINYTHEDTQINFDGPSCSKIVREWTIIDWCKWEPNGISNTQNEKYVLVKDLNTHSVYFSYGSGHHDIQHDGWYTFQQVIKILDKDPPSIKYCADIEFDLEGECSTKVKIKNRAFDTGPCPGEQLTVELKVYRTDGYVVTSKWLNAWHDKDFEVNLGYMPAGDYLIHWTVTDGCNNHGGCTQKLRVIDKNPPHLICLQDLSSAISSSDGVTIWAEDFVHKVEGPCYDDYITYSFSKDSLVTSLTFTCPDGVGLNELEVFVKASNGVYASCNTTFFVADHATCQPDAMQIAGKVTDKFKRPIEGAEVMVEAENVYVSSGMTNKNGLYSVEGITFDLGRPVIKAKVDDHTTKGLDALDLIYVLRHALNIEKLKNSDERAAADVNSDGVIDMEDYWDLTDIMYDVPGREAVIEPWKFYDSKTGIFAGFNHVRLVEPIKIARYRHEYPLIGLKTGDVNFSWTQELVGENRTAGERSNYTIDSDERGFTYSLEIPSGQHIQTFALPATNLGQGMVYQVLVNDEELAFTLTELEERNMLIVLSEKDLSGRTVQIRSTASLDLSQKGLLFDTYNVSDGKAIDWTLAESNIFENSLMVSPNPFDDRFLMQLDSETAENARLQLFDTAGRLIMTDSWNLQQGMNKKAVSLSSVQSGIFVLKIETGGQQFVQRIIKN